MLKPFQSFVFLLHNQVWRSNMYNGKDLIECWYIYYFLRNVPILILPSTDLSGRSNISMKHTQIWLLFILLCLCVLAELAPCEHCQALQPSHRQGTELWRAAQFQGIGCHVGLPQFSVSCMPAQHAKAPPAMVQARPLPLKAQELKHGGGHMVLMLLACRS